MREEEEGREAEGIGGVAEEKSGAVAEIGGVVGRGDKWLQKRREEGGSDGVVEDIFTDEKICGVEEERRVDMEGWLAESHHPEG